MIRFPDTRDMFDPPERGRFGDNESAERCTSGRATADMVDIKLVFICTSKSGLAIGVAPQGKQSGPVIYLPKSQIKRCDPFSPQNGELVDVRIPEWLAKDKGLI